MNGPLPMFRALIAAFLICASGVSARADVASSLDPNVVIPIARDIANWHRFRAGEGNLNDVSAFLDRRADWPGLKLLRRRSEANLPIGSQPDAVLAFFADQSPQTGRGARALIAAHKARGDTDAAHDQAILTWRTMVLRQEDESALIGAYEDQLKPHHEARLDMLLWRGATNGAERMLPRVGSDWQALAKARLALRAQSAGVDTLIENVPKKLQADPGLAFERMQWRARKGRSAEAIALILASGEDALGRPAAWAGWRRSLARAEMRAGRIDTAYDLAAHHGLESGSHFADLEWLAGYLALTYRKDGRQALHHFLRFRGTVETPISLGRAGYWEGRAHELIGDAENAALAYRFGAEYQTSFYGLLAAERAGVPMDQKLTGTDPSPAWQSAGFADNSVFIAARLFLDAGQNQLAEQFLRHLTETLPEPEIGSLGDFALEINEPHLAVMIAKQAARRGIVIPRAYFPVTSLGLVHMPVPRELALAIARRESEFDPNVTSGAGAKGLMQVMPATARAVAADLNIRYVPSDLIENPAYNARLGTAYLDELMAIFQGNVVMTAAGYNAGPGRPLRWMDVYGNPLTGDLNIIDWIEHIPFDETRNYVMRVTESLPVYRARLNGTMGPGSFLAELTAQPGHERNALKGNYLRPRPRPNRSEALAEPSITGPMPRPAIAADG